MSWSGTWAPESHCRDSNVAPVTCWLCRLGEATHPRCVPGALLVKGDQSSFTGSLRGLGELRAWNRGWYMVGTQRPAAHPELPAKII